MKDSSDAPTDILRRSEAEPERGRANPGDAPLPWFPGARRDEPAPVQAERGARREAALHPGIAARRLRDEGEIARGGMGAIHRVYDLALRRHVALKVIHPGLISDAALVRRFLNEARITGALGHPGVVPVHDVALRSDRLASYTMRLVQGQKLGTLIDQQASRRDLELILRSLASVCDTLAYAHSHGIVHCDLKPDNIMVGDFGEVYLMDWGCALALGENPLVDPVPDADGSIIGTPRYMSPEQARGDTALIDGRSDVFAIGAILYKALSGHAPYAGPAPAALGLAQRCAYTPIDQVTGMAVKPPPMLTAIVKRAMAPDPAQRYQNAAQLAEDLREFLRGGNWYAMQVFPAGHVIVAEGGFADAAYIILSGRCEVRKRDPADPRRSLRLRVLGTGEVFGEAAVFADMPRSASVVALDEVSAIVVDRASLQQLVNDTYLGKFVQALARRFIEADQK